MDFLQLGIDVGLVAGIVGFAQAFKKLVLERRGLKNSTPKWVIKRYKNFPMLIVLVGSVAAALSRSNPLGWQTTLEGFLKYGGASCLLYATGKLVIGKK